MKRINHLTINGCRMRGSNFKTKYFEIMKQISSIANMINKTLLPPYRFFLRNKKRKNRKGRLCCITTRELYHNTRLWSSSLPLIFHKMTRSSNARALTASVPPKTMPTPQRRRRRSITSLQKAFSKFVSFSYINQCRFRLHKP